MNGPRSHSVRYVGLVSTGRFAAAGSVEDAGVEVGDELAPGPLAPAAVVEVEAAVWDRQFDTESELSDQG